MDAFQRANPGQELLDPLVGSLDGDGLQAQVMLLFTPAVAVVPEVAERVVLVGRDGSIAADGSVRDVLTDEPRLAEHGLRPPVTVRLFDGLADDEEIPLTVSAARRYLSDDGSSDAD